MQEKSTWRIHRAYPSRIEFVAYKMTDAHWRGLLADNSPFLGTVEIDWTKYLDPDEELDQIEIKSGQRGPPVTKTRNHRGLLKRTII